MPSHALVLAKSPEPGRVKTRLSPPCSPAEAAAVAEAALADTLAAVAACGADRRLIALDGPPGPWLPTGFEVIPQVEGALDRRLAAAWARAGGPGVQIGMDTPQVSGADLDGALAALDGPGTDAVLGPADDGGWWLIGLRRADRRVFEGVPTSRSDTCARQAARLAELELRTVWLRSHRDLDTIADARAIGANHPHLASAAVVAGLP